MALSKGAATCCRDVPIKIKFWRSIITLLKSKYHYSPGRGNLNHHLGSLQSDLRSVGLLVLNLSCINNHLWTYTHTHTPTSVCLLTECVSSLPFISGSGQEQAHLVQQLYRNIDTTSTVFVSRQVFQLRNHFLQRNTSQYTLLKNKTDMDFGQTSETACCPLCYL